MLREIRYCKSKCEAQNPMIYSRQIKKYVEDCDESNSPLAVVGFPNNPENIKTRKIASSWISVQDRLPAGSGDYLVLLRSRSLRVMSYTQGAETFLPRSINQAVTHWMPLPPVPG